ncbi:hypothetical protein Tco_1167356, partial [Tanacetum coccineum]
MYFLGLQVHQPPRGISISQSQYTLDILKKHGIDGSDTIGIAMAINLKLDVDLQGVSIDQAKYRSMIGAFMCLTSCRPIVFATFFCARYQAWPTEKNLKEFKRIFRYLKKIIHMGLLYPKDSGFELTKYSDADHVGIVYHDLYLGWKALVERENVGFDLTKSGLFFSLVEDLTAKDISLRVVDSHTGNHRE